ncbi:hypothetical protein C8Q74DRAFT_1365627 [Fomes fomentarius]|nr:hypothetical protein C8Q74DRAFT_1365627 [Fomes fomentarius]
MPKATAVVSDSDSEMEITKSTKKTSGSAASKAASNKGATQNGNADSGDEDEGSSAVDDEEYEIEAILDAKHGVFAHGRVGYFVKWKGYSEEHNSWVDEHDAIGAKELISEFWKKNGKKGGPRKSETKPKPTPKQPRKSAASKEDVSEMEEEVTTAPTQKKRGRPPRTSNARAVSEEQEEEKEAPSKKKQRKSTGGKAANGRRTSVATADKDEEDEYADMKQWAEATTWEHLIESIDTVERTDDGELYVYFTLKHDKGHGRERSDICKKKMPYALIEFYEGNLRWKQTDGNAMEE